MSELNETTRLTHRVENWGKKVGFVVLRSDKAAFPECYAADEETANRIAFALDRVTTPNEAEAPE